MTLATSGRVWANDNDGPKFGALQLGCCLGAYIATVGKLHDSLYLYYVN